jgi:hypothetical protein
MRRAWLCGKSNGRSFKHRKRWIEDGILYLAKSFAEDVWAYAVISNHFHIVLYYDPNVCVSWSDEELAEHWVRAFPPTNGGVEDALASLLAEPQRVARSRADPMFRAALRYLLKMQKKLALFTDKQALFPCLVISRIHLFCLPSGPAPTTRKYPCSISTAKLPS